MTEGNPIRQLVRRIPVSFKGKNSLFYSPGNFWANIAPATIGAGLTRNQYLDDIVIFSQSFVEHMQRLRSVFQRLRASCLKLKTVFEVQYLGHIVSAEGVKVDPSKTKAVLEYPPPSDVKQLGQFSQTNIASLLGTIPPLPDHCRTNVQFNHQGKAFYGHLGAKQHLSNLK